VWAVRGSDSAFVTVVVQGGAIVAAAETTTSTPTVMLQVVPARLALDAFGIRADLKATVTGQGADSIPVSCTSGNPAVAQVDGLAVTSRSNGTAEVRCSAAGAQSVVAVSVRQRVARVKIASSRGFLARLGRDTLRLTLARVDRMRNPVSGGEARWLALDTAVIEVDRAGNALPRAIGEAKVVAVLGTFADTAQVRVVEANFNALTVQPQASRGGAAAARRGVRSARAGSRAAAVTARQGSTSQIGARDIRQTDGVFQGAGAGAIRPFGRLILSGFAASAEHRVDQGISLPVEQVTGQVYGGELTFAPFRSLGLRVLGAYGELQAQTPLTKDRTMVDVRADLEVAPISGFWIQAGGSIRGYETLSPDIIQTYTSLRVGGEFRLPLAGGSIDVTARGTYLPLTIIRPEINNPRTPLEVAVGVDYHAGRFSLGGRYELQRLDFRSEGTQTPRLEQFSAVRLRIGVDLVKK
ncbi:MAG: hypothetical protein HY560_13255, partial [Gemmatimonadetes bacterium]|nr:hypothetical protein [Gemmatimonadota bacterium]